MGKRTQQKVAKKRRRASQGRTAVPRVAHKTKHPYSKVTGVVARMRATGVSLRKAAKELQVSPRTVLKHGASALRKSKTGRYSAKASDRLIRHVKIPTPEGLLEISVRGLREASKLGRYWNLLDRYYQTGDKEIQKFAGQFITDVNGAIYPLLTDLDVLNRAGSAGVYSFESIYGRTE